MDELVISQNWPTTSHDKMNWDTAIERQRRARLEERSQLILMVSRGQESFSSHQLESLIYSTDSFFLVGAFASLPLMSPSRASLVLQDTSPSKIKSRILAFLHHHNFSSAYRP